MLFRSNRQVFRKAIACLMVFLTVNGPVWAISNTDVITSTNANVGTSGNTTTVDVLGSRSVIDWSNFNTAGAELLEFQRAGGTNFAVLNRILSGLPTQFNGTLNGNQGHIIVINANGIVFGPTADVTARRFTASTLPLEMSDADFLSGGSNFTFKTGGAHGKIELATGAEITAERVELLAHQISNSGVIVGTGDLVILATGDEIFLASESEDIVVKIAVPNTSKFTYTIANQTGGQIQNSTGKVVLAAGDTFAQAMSGIHNQAFAVGDYNIEQHGTIQAAELEAGAAQQIALRAGGSTGAGEIDLAAQKIEIRQSLETAGDITADSDDHVSVFADIKSGGDMTLTAHQSSVYLQGRTVSEGAMTIDAGTNIAMLQGASSEDTMALTAGNHVIAYNTLSSQADMTITANETLSNADITSVDDLALNSPVTLFGNTDQTLESANGRVSVDGSIQKPTPGSIYIAAQGDIRLDGDITARTGGVSAISDAGKIHTGAGNALNISIRGYSDDVSEGGGQGVDLPFKDAEGKSLGKAAIVLQSRETLILGPGAALYAEGAYRPASVDPVNGVDDRAGANFLAADAAIGGFDRNQGVPSDIAIYVGSTGGNVIVQTPAIAVSNSDEGASATVVFDAYDTVSMPFLAGLANGDSKFGGFRLEVASRITEWLFQAVGGGKLPFAANPAFVEAILGNDYVLRGAGLDNPAITDGRAWVLENPAPTPVPAPLPVLELPVLKGCPVEMQAAAGELGIPAEMLQMTFRNALAMNPNIQPCEACARLVTAAAILTDADGIRLAAMNQIFSTLAPADAPFTPEVSASVVTAFAQLGDQDRQYALAAEYVDAFVRYVAVLDKEFKAPIGDAVAFALEKHGAALTADNANPNIAAYILAQLMQETL